MDTNAIRESIQKIAGTYGKANIKLFDATVLTVDIESRTCTVDSVDSSLFGITVRFMVDISDGDMSVPSVDSTVTVAMSDFTDPYIVSSSWLDQKLIIVGDQSFSMINGQQVFNDGSFGGLVKVIELTTKLNNLEKLLSDLITKFNSHVHSGVTTGGGSSAVTTTPETGTISETSRSDIENTNITHGSNF